MLNITKIYQYSKQEAIHVQEVVDSRIAEGKDPWNDKKKATQELKTKIREFLDAEQDGRCVFCEMPLVRAGKHIEHFIARQIIREFAFEPKNLFLSCPSCNSRAVKDDKGIIEEPGNKSVYEKNKFLVVHPYLHNPDEHIVFLDDERVIFDESKCTSLGLNTISVFKWNEPAAIKDRAVAYYSGLHSKEIQDKVNKALIYPTQNHLAK